MHPINMIAHSTGFLHAHSETVVVAVALIVGLVYGGYSYFTSKK